MTSNFTGQTRRKSAASSPFPMCEETLRPYALFKEGGMREWNSKGPIHTLQRGITMWASRRLTRCAACFQVDGKQLLIDARASTARSSSQSRSMTSLQMRLGYAPLKSGLRRRKPALVCWKSSDFVTNCDKKLWPHFELSGKKDSLPSLSSSRLPIQTACFIGHPPRNESYIKKP